MPLHAIDYTKLTQLYYTAESAKLRALRALMPYMSLYPTFPRASVPGVSCVPSVFSCSLALLAHVSMCLTSLFSLMPKYLTCPRAFVPYVPR